MEKKERLFSAEYIKLALFMLVFMAAVVAMLIGADRLINRSALPLDAEKMGSATLYDYPGGEQIHYIASDTVRLLADTVNSLELQSSSAGRLTADTVYALDVRLSSGKNMNIKLSEDILQIDNERFTGDLAALHKILDGVCP